MLAAYLTHPLSQGALAPLARLGRAIPTGVFDNEGVHRFLSRAFGERGRTNDFRKLHRELYLIGTDLDSGAAVEFGAPGLEHVPISLAVQASAALPGLCAQRMTLSADRPVTVTVRDVTSPGASAGPDQTVDEDATATLSGAGSTDNVGVANYTWAFTDGSPRTLYGSSATYVFATPGVYTVTLTVRDAAGNAAADTLTVTVRDVTLPAASIDSPASEATVSGTLVIGVTASDNVGVARVELRLDGALVATDTTAPYSFSLSTGNYSDGTHTLRVTAYDAAGNPFSTDRTVTFSNPRPPQGLGFVEYGGIVLLVLGAAAVAWLIFRRGKRRKPTNMPPPSETSPPDELDVESHGQP